METIIILAKALSEAAKSEILRLDIQYNDKAETYTGRVWLSSDPKAIFDVHEDGTVTLPH